MALQFGNLLGAVANVTTILNKEKSLKSFLDNIDDFGVQTKNNFEVNFSGLSELTFRIQTINLPTIKANTTTVYYDGRSIPVLINYDFEHDFSMTLLNDAQGYLYTAVADFIMSNANVVLAGNAGYTMTIKALTGDDKHYDGTLITCEGVKLINVSGLDFGQAANDVQTFTVSGVMQQYKVTPGALGTIAGAMGTINSLLG